MSDHLAGFAAQASALLDTLKKNKGEIWTYWISEETAQDMGDYGGQSAWSHSLRFDKGLTIKAMHRV